MIYDSENSLDHATEITIFHSPSYKSVNYFKLRVMINFNDSQIDILGRNASMNLNMCDNLKHVKEEK